MKTRNQVQILDEAFCIPPSGNTLEKDMNLIIFTLNMDK